jgi:ubiquinone biosynthesis protein UbiJ
LVFEHETNAPTQQPNDDKATIARLVEEVESLKKLSAELNKRLNDLSHR